MTTTRAATPADVAVPPAEAGPADGYRPHLDGLRAVAVYLVVLFHAGSHPFSGGYIGVDVFFVLSGFLVTRLLLKDIVGSGAIRFGRFYSRRFRRLLPAAFVVLVVTAAVYSAIASPSEALGAVGSFKAAFLYSTNWYLIHHASGYFGADIASNPVLHFWSLAVEEQFYLLWPLVLSAGFALTRRLDHERQMRVIRIGVVVAALASVVWALSLRTANPNHAYYGTDARAYELLSGAFLALVPALLLPLRQYKRAMRATTVVSALVLLVLASSWWNADAIVRGVVVTITTCALIIGLEHSDGGALKRGLSTRTMTYLGKISYGTYLWHWLVILVVVKEFHVSTTATIGIALLLSTALASLSFDLMEHPVRVSARLDGYRRVVIAVGLSISLIGALVVVPTIIGSPTSRTVAVAAGAVTSGLAPVPPGLDWEAVKKEKRTAPNCFRAPVQRCVLVHGTGLKVDLLGDSHAEMLIPPLVAIAHRRNWTLSVTTLDACPWQDGLYRFTGAIKADCLAQKADWENRIIPALNPKVVILVNAPADKPGVKGLHLGGPNGPLAMGSPAAEQALEAGATRTVAHFRREGRDVVIIEPIPQGPPGSDPIACLSKAKYLDQCRFVVNPDPSALELKYRALDRADKHVWSLSLDKLICPYDPICDPVVDGQIVWYDLSHLSLVFAATLADPIEAFFVDNGIGTN